MPHFPRGTDEQWQAAMETAADRIVAADVTREPTGGQGLREAVERGLHRHESGGGWDGCPACTDRADAVLALPELAALIADAERVRRVRELAHSWKHPLKPDHHWYADRLLRALNGDVR